MVVVNFCLHRSGMWVGGNFWEVWIDSTGMLISLATMCTTVCLLQIFCWHVSSISLFWLAGLITGQILCLNCQAQPKPHLTRTLIPHVTLIWQTKWNICIAQLVKVETDTKIVSHTHLPTNQKWKNIFLSASRASKTNIFCHFFTSFDKVLALNTA